MISVVISSNLPDVVDAYISIRAQRLQLDRQAADIKEQEETLKEHIIGHFRTAGMSALGGKAGLVKMQELDEPDPQDWEQIYSFIQENGAWELLHKRIGSAAVKERWEAGESIPGIGHKTVYKLSVSGTGAK